MSISENENLSSRDSDIKLLTSWKEIADFLNVSSKTAQRYEASLGLPVKRLNGRVWISVEELTSWREASSVTVPSRNNLPLVQRLAIASMALIVLAGLWVSVRWFLQSPGEPSSADVSGYALDVKDKKGNLIWRHTFELPFFPEGTLTRMSYRVVDINNDGSLETVGVWQHVERDSRGWSFQCFTATGKLAWDLKLADEVQTASGKKFGPPYVIRAFKLVDSPEKDGTKWVAVLFVHVLDVSSTLIVADSKGKRRGQYWHVGHLNDLELFDADGDGREDLVAAGVRHGVEQAVLVAFDPGNVSGTNIMPHGHPRTIIGQGPGSEKMTGFIARSRLAEYSRVFNFVANLQLVNGRLRAHVYETYKKPEGYLLYDFQPGLRVSGVSMSAAYGAAYEEFADRREVEKLVPEKELERLRIAFRAERTR